MSPMQHFPRLLPQGGLLAALPLLILLVAGSCHADMDHTLDLLIQDKEGNAKPAAMFLPTPGIADALLSLSQGSPQAMLLESQGKGVV